MGLAWIPDDAGQDDAGHGGARHGGTSRHRRPTLLARGGQAVAGRFASDPGAGGLIVGPVARSLPGARIVRRAVLPARRYWT
jgi:hypothetical protein